jgi:hypothetical protein
VFMVLYYLNFKGLDTYKISNIKLRLYFWHYLAFNTVRPLNMKYFLGRVHMVIIVYTSTCLLYIFSFSNLGADDYINIPEVFSLLINREYINLSFYCSGYFYYGYISLSL